MTLAAMPDSGDRVEHVVVHALDHLLHFRMTCRIEGQVANRRRQDVRVEIDCECCDARKVLCCLAVVPVAQPHLGHGPTALGERVSFAWGRQHDGRAAGAFGGRASERPDGSRWRSRKLDEALLELELSMQERHRMRLPPAHSTPVRFSFVAIVLTKLPILIRSCVSSGRRNLAVAAGACASHRSASRKRRCFCRERQGRAGRSRA